MALIDIFPPSWAAGELLSAAKANQLSDVVNGIKGRRWRRPPFVRSGNDTIWYMRRHGHISRRLHDGRHEPATRILVNGQTGTTTARSTRLGTRRHSIWMR